MKKWFCLFLFFVLIPAAYASGGEKQVAQESAKQSAGMQDAVKAATRHLALRNVRWGVPEEVEENEDEYLVHFPTPNKELRLIGERVLVVEKASGAVFVKPRR